MNDFPTSASSSWPPPVLWPTPKLCVWLSGDGEVEELTRDEAALRARRTPPLVCHARAATRRLNCDRFATYDLLELFAFVRPAQFCLPTPRGLARAFDLPVPESHIDEALILPKIAELLLDEITITIAFRIHQITNFLSPKSPFNQHIFG